MLPLYDTCVHIGSCFCFVSCEKLIDQKRAITVSIPFKRPQNKDTIDIDINLNETCIVKTKYLLFPGHVNAIDKYFIDLLVDCHEP